MLKNSSFFIFEEIDPIFLIIPFLLCSRGKITQEYNGKFNDINQIVDCNYLPEKGCQAN